MAGKATVLQGEETRNKIMEAIVGYIEIHQYPPSYQEIGDMVGLRSRATVHTHIKKLLEEGKIETDAGIGFPRAIRIPGYKFTKIKEMED